MLAVIAMGESGNLVSQSSDYFATFDHLHDPSSLASYPGSGISGYTASGAYGITLPLYTEEVARLGLTDWGVATQDEMAVDILIRKGVMHTLLKSSMSQSDFVNVIDALKSRFSSLGTDASSATYAHDWALFQSLGHVSQ